MLLLDLTLLKLVAAKKPTNEAKEAEDIQLIRIKISKKNKIVGWSLLQLEIA